MKSPPPLARLAFGLALLLPAPALGTVLLAGESVSNGPSMRGFLVGARLHSAVGQALAHPIVGVVGGPAAIGGGQLHALLDRSGGSTEAPPVTRAQLEQNVPNPFNPSTTLSFALPEAARVELVVMDARGRLVETLLQGEYPAGRHELQYQPATLPSGVYFYQLRTPERTLTRRFLLLK